MRVSIWIICLCVAAFANHHRVFASDGGEFPKLFIVIIAGAFVLCLIQDIQELLK